ncbi:MAG: hypothetical protein VB141_12510, partial [Burkholderia gladioli]
RQARAGGARRSSPDLLTRRPPASRFTDGAAELFEFAWFLHAENWPFIASPSQLSMRWLRAKDIHGLRPGAPCVSSGFFCRFVQKRKIGAQIAK